MSAVRCWHLVMAECHSNSFGLSISLEIWMHSTLSTGRKLIHFWGHHFGIHIQAPEQVFPPPPPPYFIRKWSKLVVYASVTSQQQPKSTWNLTFSQTTTSQVRPLSVMAFIKIQSKLNKVTGSNKSFCLIWNFKETSKNKHKLRLQATGGNVNLFVKLWNP